MATNTDALQTQRLEENLQRIKNKIVVMSGKGGVGKSTVSVNLAYALALDGLQVGLLDADLHGPSLARMTGIEDKQVQLDEDGRPIPPQAISNLHVISIASFLQHPDDPVIWRGPAKNGAIKQFLSDIVWPDLDYLIVDCPPGTGDEPLSVIQLMGEGSRTVIVSTPQDVALLDVRKSVKFAEKMDLPIVGVVENMSGFICPGCGTRTDIFKTGGTVSLEKELDVEILGNVPIEPAIVTSCDEGKAFIYNHPQSESARALNGVKDRMREKIEVQ